MGIYSRFIRQLETCTQKHSIVPHKTLRKTQSIQALLPFRVLEQRTSSRGISDGPVVEYQEETETNQLTWMLLDETHCVGKT